MDYLIRRKADALDSTGYIEIGLGKYSGQHWRDGFLFVWEDAFGMAEGILAKHLPEYDHFGMNDVARDIGLTVTAEWRRVAAQLPAMSADEASEALHLESVYRADLGGEVASHRKEIAALLQQLADECERLYRANEWICILGM